MGPACICCGQSTNLAKLYRNSAFTWYSSAACASDGVAKPARKHNPKVQTSQRVALALGTGHWDGRTRIARDFSEDASLSFRTGHRGRIAVFESPRPEQVLSYDAEFQRLAMPPANPRVQ